MIAYGNAGGLSTREKTIKSNLVELIKALIILVTTTGEANVTIAYTEYQMQNIV